MFSPEVYSQIKAQYCVLQGFIDEFEVVVKYMEKNIEKADFRSLVLQSYTQRDRSKDFLKTRQEQFNAALYLTGNFQDNLEKFLLTIQQRIQAHLQLVRKIRKHGQVFVFKAGSAETLEESEAEDSDKSVTFNNNKPSQKNGYSNPKNNINPISSKRAYNQSSKQGAGQERGEQTLAQLRKQINKASQRNQQKQRQQQLNQSSKKVDQNKQDRIKREKSQNINKGTVMLSDDDESDWENDDERNKKQSYQNKQANQNQTQGRKDDINRNQQKQNNQEIRSKGLHDIVKQMDNLQEQRTKNRNEANAIKNRFLNQTKPEYNTYNNLNNNQTADNGKFYTQGQRLNNKTQQKLSKKSEKPDIVNLEEDNYDSDKSGDSLVSVKEDKANDNTNRRKFTPNHPKAQDHPNFNKPPNTNIKVQNSKSFVIPKINKQKPPQNGPSKPNDQEQPAAQPPQPSMKSPLHGSLNRKRKLEESTIDFDQPEPEKRQKYFSDQKSQHIHKEEVDGQARNVKSFPQQQNPNPNPSSAQFQQNQTYKQPNHSQSQGYGIQQQRGTNRYTEGNQRPQQTYNDEYSFLFGNDDDLKNVEQDGKNDDPDIAGIQDNGYPQKKQYAKGFQYQQFQKATPAQHQQNRPSPFPQNQGSTQPQGPNQNIFNQVFPDRQNKNDVGDGERKQKMNQDRGLYNQGLGKGAEAKSNQVEELRSNEGEELLESSPDAQQLNDILPHRLDPEVEKQEWAQRKEAIDKQNEEAKLQKQVLKQKKQRERDLEVRQQERLTEYQNQQDVQQQMEEQRQKIRIDVVKSVAALFNSYQNRYLEVLKKLGIVDQKAIFLNSQEMAKAQRRALAKYHPDKVAGQNLRTQIEHEEIFKQLNDIFSKQEKKMMIR